MGDFEQRNAEETTYRDYDDSCLRRSVGGLFCISLLKISALILDRFPTKQRETYIKISTKRIMVTQNLMKSINNTVKPPYVNTLNLNFLFDLKRRTMTQYKIFVQ